MYMYIYILFIYILYICIYTIYIYIYIYYIRPWHDTHKSRKKEAWAGDEKPALPGGKAAWESLTESLVT